MAFDINKLPKWALPLGVGGLVGIGVLMTRGGSGGKSPTLTPIPVNGQEPGNVDQSVTSLLTQFFTQFGTQQEATLDTFTDMISAQNEAMAARDTAFATMIQGFAKSIQDAIGKIEIPTNPPTTNPPTTNPPTTNPPTTNPPANPGAKVPRDRSKPFPVNPPTPRQPPTGEAPKFPYAPKPKPPFGSDRPFPLTPVPINTSSVHVGSIGTRIFPN